MSSSRHLVLSTRFLCSSLTLWYVVRYVQYKQLVECFLLSLLEGVSDSFKRRCTVSNNPRFDQAMLTISQSPYTDIRVG